MADIILTSLFCIGMWVLIITIRSLALYLSKSDHEGCWFYDVDKEMIADGNNLFTTCVMYIVVYIACYVIRFDILSWIAIVVGTAFCLFPILSILMSVTLKFKMYRDKYIFMSLLTACINAFTPLFVVWKIYTTCLN